MSLKKRKIKVNIISREEANLSKAHLEEDERKKWLQSHKEVNNFFPIPDTISRIKPKSIHNSWFSYTRMRPQEKSSNTHNSLSNWLPEEKVAKNILRRNKVDNSVIRTRICLLHADKILPDKVKLIMEATAYIYNKCVKLANEGKVPLKELTKMFVTKGGSHMPSDIKEKFKGIHYDIRNGAIDDFKLAFKNQLQAIEGGRITHFNMSYMRKKYRHISIRARQLRMDDTGHNLTTIFKNLMHEGERQYFYSKAILPVINRSVKLFFKNRKLYIAIPIDCMPKKKSNGKIVALDPGVRAFQTTYDNRGISYIIGAGDIAILEGMKAKACNLREGWKTGITEKLDKPTKGMKRVARKIEEKIKNKVNDIHRRLAKFLCSNYDTIIIPPLEVSKMVKRCERIIGKKTAREMYQWSHFKFRELLISKGEQTATRIEVRNEKYTSKVCTKCLFVNKNLGSAEIYNCSSCKMSLSRDINGARNILIKNWSYI